VATPSIEGTDLVERQNYLKVRKHLAYLSEVLQVAPESLQSYRFHLRHLLLWADSRNLNGAIDFRPSFPAYLTSQPGKDGIQISAQIPAWTRRVWAVACSDHGRLQSCVYEPDA